MSAAAAENSGLLRVAEIKGRGRGLVACQPLRAGQVVLRDSPVLLYSAFPLINQSSSSSSYPSTANSASGILSGTHGIAGQGQAQCLWAYGAFSLHNDGQRSVRAYGIYPNASFFNHDCLPNACRFDYVDTAPDQQNNIDIIVRMIHDVPQGREICLSYFPVEANWSDDDDIVEEEEVEENEVMDEDLDDEIMESSQGKGDDDFPHAYFFLRYMCDRENCGGTLAPLTPDATPSDVMDVMVAVLCFCCYNTLLLYALVTQMGSSMKKSIFEEQTSKALKKWHMAVKKKHPGRGGQSPVRTLGQSPTSSTVHSLGHTLHRFKTTGYSTRSTYKDVETSDFEADPVSTSNLIIRVDHDEEQTQTELDELHRPEETRDEDDFSFAKPFRQK
ncbi:Histone-lysine N-methyltransferase ASHR2 [Morella rubra]|uniref:Histone-lysine N-methyltransferase ASHR2 n=1 Tax=Morella rubra TaxID=262757 RepID=A0A6A1UQA5_9ROSI|nr:Histone-lysine N-methyltransferase ASHR2 [Morella rubra]